MIWTDMEINGDFNSYPLLLRNEKLQGPHTISASACVSGCKEKKCHVWCLKNQEENKIGMVITMRSIF